MDTNVDKLDLINWIINLNDEKLLSKIKNLRKENNIISNASIESIQKGINDIKEGKSHSYSDVKKVYEKYL